MCLQVYYHIIRAIGSSSFRPSQDLALNSSLSDRILYCNGLLRSAFRRLSIDPGFTRLWRACPPLFLPAVFVAEWRTGGLEGLPAVILEGWPADHLMAASFTGRRIQGLKMTPIHKLLQSLRPPRQSGDRLDDSYFKAVVKVHSFKDGFCLLNFLFINLS